MTADTDQRRQPRRNFLKTAAAAPALLAAGCATSRVGRRGLFGSRRPNIVFVFADQWRAQTVGYAGDPNAQTPEIDRLHDESVDFPLSVSTCPVCTPYRACLLTGQYPLTHGLFLNDLCLPDRAETLAEIYHRAGYDTAYLGKWHLDGHGRSACIPPERRQGFRFWRGNECTHNYNKSIYYADEDPEPRWWQGYDAIDQTRASIDYIREHAADDKPFALVLSWGPPHNPYQTAPETFRRRFDPDRITLRANVPDENAESARKDLAGYYSHVAALDECVGAISGALEDAGIAEDTVFVLTSDHGDMLGSQGHQRKQRPWDESILTPFLLRYPARFGREARRCDTPFGSPDILPTLLSLCDIEIPGTVEGRDFTPDIEKPSDRSDPHEDAALIMCVSPFGEFIRRNGGREYRGVRTRRHTYVRTLEGPWLLYDNERDPYQMRNLCNDEEHADLRRQLDQRLDALLDQTGDEFLHGDRYIERWNYPVDGNGTVPYH